MRIRRIEERHEPLDEAPYEFLVRHHVRIALARRLAAGIRERALFAGQFRLLFLNPSATSKRCNSVSCSSISERRQYDAAVKCRASAVRSSSRSSSAAATARAASGSAENPLLT